MLAIIGMIVQALAPSVTTNSDLLMVIADDLLIFRRAFLAEVRGVRGPIGAAVR